MKDRACNNPSKKKSAEILQNLCNPYPAEFVRKNGQQNFHKIYPKFMQNFRKMSAESRSFLEFPKMSVQIRICAEFPENVCRKHNLLVTDFN